MQGKEALFPLSGQTPVIRVAGAMFIFLASSLILTIILYAAGSFLFPGWSDARTMLVSGEIENVAPAIIRYLQAGQEFALFIIPSLLISYAMQLDLSSEMGLKKYPSLASITLVLIVVLLVLVVNTYIAWLNSKMTLPQRWSSIEEWMKAKELIAQQYTILLTSKTSSSSLYTNIIIVALLPAIGEEFFFRGVVQKLLAGFFKNGNAAVWITAIIFSAIHFQFYGFLPRLLLGLIFGYLFLWSGSIWLPVVAHLVNNLIPVVVAWFVGWNEGTNITEHLVNTNPVSVIFSVLVVIAVMILLKRELKSDKQSE